MKRGVEARDLRQLGHAFGDDTDRRQIVGLMQRGERNEVLEPGKDLRVDQCWLRIFKTTMNDPVAHRDQAVVFAMPPQKLNQVADGAVMTEARALLPLAGADVRTSRIFGAKNRRGVKAFDLTAQQ